MRQLLQNLGNGQTMVLDVPAPGPQRGALLIRTTQSLISAGTERMLVDFGKAGWLGKARQQPEKVRAVLNKIRANGLLETVRAVRSKLSQPIPLGYCQVGVVVAAGGDGSSFLDNGSWLGASGQVGGGRRAEDGCGISGSVAGSQVAKNQEPITENQAPSAPRFRAGDRVVSNGPHAEVVSVSRHLCARIPDEVSDEAATFTPLAAIALEGIHLLAPQPGDRVVVTGLGLIGQLAVRILRAMGCEVLGLDPSAERRALAERSGASCASGDPVAAALAWTSGKGVAGVLITASTSSNEVVNQAARSCRRRGKVVLVGVVGLQLNRADFYRNEVSFQVSCSYGTRDGKGEHSARRNFEQVLARMAAGQLPVEDLITHRFGFEDAPAAYGALADRSSLGTLLSYGRGAPAAAPASHEVAEAVRLSPRADDEILTNSATERRLAPRSGGDVSAQRGRGRIDDLLVRTITVRKGREEAQEPIRDGVAVIGAGNFAMRTLLPAMRELPAPPRIVAVASRQGAPALLAAMACGAERATTDVGAVIADPTIAAVFITTRHDAHAREAIAALQAGKNVWVEKPLCLTLDELAAIEAALRSQASSLRPQVSTFGSQPPAFSSQLTATDSTTAKNQEPLTDNPAPLLMVGFNRRFAPIAVALRTALAARPAARRFVVTVNAGRLDPDHWALDPVAGGGRIVGEGCHFVDLLRFLAGTAIAEVRCVRRDSDGQDGGAFELHFADGSTGLLDYRTDLPAHHPKESIEVTGTNGESAVIENWARLRTEGMGGLSVGNPFSRTPRKGHREALQAFLAAIAGDGPVMPLDEVLEVSRWAIVMQGMQEGRTQGAPLQDAGGGARV
jgi:predicted dehydrogenase/threonine dehydrogenase-like Zn-dependent dehydrogenase